MFLDDTDGDDYDDYTCNMGNGGAFSDAGSDFCFNAAKTFHTEWYSALSGYVNPLNSNVDMNLVGIDDVYNDRNQDGQKLATRIRGTNEVDLYMIFNRKKGINGEVEGDADTVHIVQQRTLSSISLIKAALGANQSYTQTNWGGGTNSLIIKVCR